MSKTRFEFGQEMKTKQKTKQKKMDNGEVG